MSDVTQILSQIESGDPSVAVQLSSLLYDVLRKLAEEWKVRHPESKETVAQLKTRSENYAAEKNRGAKHS